MVYNSHSPVSPVSNHDAPHSQPALVLSGQKRELERSQITPNRYSPPYNSIHEWFEAQVERTPEAIALVFNHQTLTYRELNERANQLAHYLLSHGLQREELVAISMHRCLEMVIAFWGVLKAGGAYVPLDPTYPHERRAYKLQDSQTRLILTQNRLIDDIPTHPATIVSLDTDWREIAAYSRKNPDLPTDPEQLAYVIYTSGSTGNPKGVKIPHRGMMNHSAAMAREFELQASDRVMQFSSMSFDIIVEEVFPSLVHGAAVVLRSEEISSSIRKFLEFVERHQITILNLPTAFWHEMVKSMTLLQVPLPPSVRLVIVGGEKASRLAYAQWLKLAGEQTRWLNTYGPTETTVTATIYDPIAAQYHPDQGEIPIGKPIANAEVYILDPELNQVPVGEVGELHIGGPGLALGYLNLPTRTADKFIPNPLSDDPMARLYKTGDTVRYLPNGNLEFVGRIDFQVKIRGFRIELGEIEICLEQYPAVQQAIVLAREDIPGKDKCLVGYLAVAANQALDMGDVRTYLKQKLPEFMIPTAFVEVESFSLTPNGKVDRRALPVPDVVPEETKTVVAPSNATEAKLLQIWQDVLGIQAISITDNFFDLGGHSLLVARLLDQIAIEFGNNLPLSTLFQASTLEQLATVLTQPEQFESLLLIRAGGSKSPIFFIHDGDGETMLYRSLAFQLDPERPIYGIQPLASPRHPILHTRIEQMAAYYLEKIRSVQPEGPYWLAGLCAGGVLAYEVARQLQEQGQAIAMVALLDAAEPGAKVRTGHIAHQRFSSLAETLQSQQAEQGTIPVLSLILNLLAIVGSKAWNTVSYELSSSVRQVVDTAKMRLFRFYLDRGWTPPALCRNLSVRRTYVLAEQSYVPETTLDAEMVLFRATVGEGLDQPYQEIYADPLMGWEERTTQRVCAYDVAGGHSSMLQEPHVRGLAELMQAYLDRAANPQNLQPSQLMRSH